MSFKKFSGFSVVTEQFVERISGFRVNLIENLFIRVRDLQGNLLKCTIIVIQGGVVQGEYTDNPLNVYMMEETEITVIARAINHEQKQETLTHGGESAYLALDFHLDKQYSIRTNIKP